jgi:PAS domain S-box-containing protein
MVLYKENIINDELDSFKDFENFFDISQDLLCIAGFDGYFKRINPAVCKLLGYSKEELLAKPINEFIYYDDQLKTKEARNDLRKKKSLYNFENRYTTKSGSIVWLLWTSMPIESKKLVYAIAKNITHKKELEEERNNHLTELTKINNEFKQLTYTNAHDLRSPVNNMLSVFELLDVSKITDTETLEFISILKSTTLTLRQALDESIEVLDKKNEADIFTEELSLNDSLNEVLLSIKSLIQNSVTTINVDFSEFENVTFNKTSLKSVFLNLITNSIKYAKPDCRANITITSRKFKKRKQLIISDNGIGFEMDIVKDKIFGLHQKFHNNTDSNGIGLYLVYNHITSLGGQIVVESKVNEGAKFIITFKE